MSRLVAGQVSAPDVSTPLVRFMPIFTDTPQTRMNGDASPPQPLPAREVRTRSSRPPLVEASCGSLAASSVSSPFHPFVPHIAENYYTAAPNQSSFHHYRDLVSSSATWRDATRLKGPVLLVVLQHRHPLMGALRHETPSFCSVGPSNGHVEALDLQVEPPRGRRCSLIRRFFAPLVLFGGFQDTGIRTSYLSDLWVWDTLEYKWHQIEIADVDRKPGCVPSRFSFPAGRKTLTQDPPRARSGFSFLSCPEGIVLHGKHPPPFHSLSLCADSCPRLSKAATRKPTKENESPAWRSPTRGSSASLPPSRAKSTTSSSSGRSERRSGTRRARGRGARWPFGEPRSSFILNGATLQKF